jgi:hypothetical protein
LCSKNTFNNFYRELFNYSVKFEWLRRKFVYYTERTKAKMQRNSILLCNAFVKFFRRNVGVDPQMITRNNFFYNIVYYLDEFFPDFDIENPFENPDYYRFPFENISIDFLPVVRQMDERVELLKIADERKMSYAVFVDYVINYAFSVNEELGRDRYIIKSSARRRCYLFYIRDTDKYSNGKFKFKKRKT